MIFTFINIFEMIVFSGIFEMIVTVIGRTYKNTTLIQ